MASLNKKTTTAGQSGGVKPAKAKKTKPVKPAILIQAEAEKDVKKLLGLFGIDGLSASRGYGYYSYEYNFQLGFLQSHGVYSTIRSCKRESFLEIVSTRVKQSVVRAPGGVNESKISMPVVYAGEDGTVWASTFNFIVRGELFGVYSSSQHGYTQDTVSICPDATMAEFKASEKYLCGHQSLQSDKELLEIIRNLNPYAHDFVVQNDVEPMNYLMAPYLETLSKAGYAFVDQFFVQDTGRYRHGFPTDVECLNRLCRRGSNPADIFKTTKAVYKVLGPAETNMELWDTYRKLDKFGRISQETIRQSYDHAMSVKDLDLINTILGQQYNGKPVFDWDTLYHYLVRLDKFEAIGNNEALILIRDYLNMCRQLGMRPRTDGDSLKREHDVAARLCRTMRSDKLAKAMQPACEKLARFDYYEGVYFIRGIQSFEDLLSEATQQHSCLVSYGEDISKGRSQIYVMREVARPERSLITVELSMDNRSITQALTAYNKHIRNKSMHDFLERWLRYVRDVDKLGAA